MTMTESMKQALDTIGTVLLFLAVGLMIGWAAFL